MASPPPAPADHHHEDRPRITPYVPLIIGIAAASTSSIFIRYAQREAPSLVIAAYRLTLATLLLLPAVLRDWKKHLQPLSNRLLQLSILSGLFLTVHFATWISSLEFTSIASSVALVQTAPILVALLSPFLLKERLAPLAWLGIGIAFAGSILISVSDVCSLQGYSLHCPGLGTVWSDQALKGDLLALAGAASVSGYLLIGRKIRSKMSLLAYLFLTYGTAAVSLTILAALAGHRFFGYSSMVYLWFLLLALLPQLTAHSSVNWALRYLPAAVVSIFLLGEPIGSAILAVFILDEIPPPLRICGGIAIIAGILLTVLARNTQPENAV